MAKDFIGYQGLADAALRSVVREALRKVEKQGLIGAHHFFLTFKTHFPGLEIPNFLREQYPDEMTIILQHQFWGLKVREDRFEVTLTFKTGYPGVEIPDFLREQYPEEMMIILQHQFWGLKVREDQFEVTLSFKKVPATLTVPFAALTQFADPGVSFGLQFRGVDDDEPKPSTPAVAPTPLTPPAKPEPAAAAEPAAEKPEPHGEVVSLDAFRKK